MVLERLKPRSREPVGSQLREQRKDARYRFGGVGAELRGGVTRANADPDADARIRVPGEVAG